MCDFVTRYIPCSKNPKHPNSPNHDSVDSADPVHKRFESRSRSFSNGVLTTTCVCSDGDDSLLVAKDAKLTVTRQMTAELMAPWCKMHIICILSSSNFAKNPGLFLATTLFGDVRRDSIVTSRLFTMMAAMWVTAVILEARQ